MSENSKNVESMGHHLFIQNRFSLSKKKILDTFNFFLKALLQHLRLLLRVLYLNAITNNDQRLMGMMVL